MQSKNLVCDNDITNIFVTRDGAPSETGFWKKYTGSNGMNFGISDFGRSAPYKDIYNHFGLNVDNIVKEIKKKYENKNRY